MKGKISSLDEERLLSDFLLEAVAERGEPGRISFDDPELVIDLETVGNEAGLACWTREQLNRYPLLKID
jgi:hypothetical protein